MIGVHYEKVKKGDRHAERRVNADAHPLAQAVMNALREVIGAYGIGVICSDYPDVMVGARRGSPLIVGVGEGEHFLASDASAIVAHTRQVVYLNDYDVVTLTPERFNMKSLGSGTAQFQISKLEYRRGGDGAGASSRITCSRRFSSSRARWRTRCAGGIDHDEATAKFGGLNMSTAELRAIDRIVITACGTSWHAALVGEYLIEEFAHIPVEVEYASEFRYRNAPIEKNTLVLAITQSGETADTLASLRETRAARAQGAGDLQRGRQHDRARSGRRHLSARGAGDRRGVHEGVHVAGHGRWRCWRC